MSHVMDNQLTIIKRDDLGRVQRTTESRVAAIAESQRSGLFATAFAKMAGIAPYTFWNWLHAQGLTQKRGSSKAASPSPTRFVQVAAPASASSVLFVRLPGGDSLEVTDERQAVLAARLIESLASSHCDA